MRERPSTRLQSASRTWALLHLKNQQVRRSNFRPRGQSVSAQPGRDKLALESQFDPLLQYPSKGGSRERKPWIVILRPRSPWRSQGLPTKGPLHFRLLATPSATTIRFWVPRSLRSLQGAGGVNGQSRACALPSARPDAKEPEAIFWNRRAALHQETRLGANWQRDLLRSSFQPRRYPSVGCPTLSASVRKGGSRERKPWIVILRPGAARWRATPNEGSVHSADNFIS